MNVFLAPDGKAVIYLSHQRPWQGMLYYDSRLLHNMTSVVWDDPYCEVFACETSVGMHSGWRKQMSGQLEFNGQKFWRCKQLSNLTFGLRAQLSAIETFDSTPYCFLANPDNNWRYYVVVGKYPPHKLRLFAGTERILEEVDLMGARFSSLTGALRLVAREIGVIELSSLSGQPLLGRAIKLDVLELTEYRFDMCDSGRRFVVTEL